MYRSTSTLNASIKYRKTLRSSDESSESDSGGRRIAPVIRTLPHPKRFVNRYFPELETCIYASSFEPQALWRYERLNYSNALNRAIFKTLINLQFGTN